MTAYFAKLLAMASPYTNVESKHIHSALEFVTKNQLGDGSFREIGLYYHRYANEQKGTNTLTAFCAIALTQGQKYFHGSFETQLNKALNLLSMEAIKVKDNFALAISAYALALNQHKEAEKFVKELKKNSIRGNGEMYWYREPNCEESSSSLSLNVEIASYALLAFIETNKTSDAVEVMKWLMKMRNSNGGFESSTDTVIGIQALARIAEKLPRIPANMKVKLETERNKTHTFRIKESNAMTLQKIVLEKDARNIKVHVNGTGNALIQVSYSYKTMIKDGFEFFQLEVDHKLEGTILYLKICSNIIETFKENSTGMTLIEIHLPSGFVYHTDTATMVLKKGVRVRCYYHVIIL